ncbi:MAG TPA: TonB-dependent receptor [Candidatus Acidoferrum sp.]|nr:TonB-dependent receptor [Candidatus Acidoferrum sp.]
MKRAVNGITLAVMVCLTLALVGLSVVPANAQVSKGSISGAVTDAQAASVLGASIKAVSKDTSQVYSTETDNAGLFRLSLLPPGSYRVEVTKQGFRKIVFDSIEVSVGADRGIGAVKLEIGEVTATVEVSAAPALMESTEAQITNAFTATDLQTFAGVLENQGLDNLALTVPGVVNNRDLGFSNTNGPGFAVNGLRGRNNDQQIDGQNNNDNSVAGPGLFVSDVEFVQEYQITTSNFSAEYGRNSGSVVNVITKSGTNNVHGAVFGTESSSKLNALSNTQKAFEGLTRPARFNDEFTGGTIGGPLWREHVFFFGGFDNEIVSQRQSYSSGSFTPTPTGVATLLACYGNTASLQALQMFGPYAIAGGNPTPQGIDPKSPSLTNCTDGVTRALELGGVNRTLPSGSKSYNFPIRLDIQTAKNHFYGRYIYNRSTFFNADSFVLGGAASGYPNNVPALSQDYGFSWARTLSSRMSNEFRASFGRLNVEFGGNSIGNTIPNQGNIGGAISRIVFNDPTRSDLAFGPATNAPQGRIVNTYQLQDNWSYFRGRHSLKAGVNLTDQRSPNAFLPNLNGEFRFTNWSTFARDIPNRVRIASGDPKLNFREKDTFAYFGDDFKVKNNLTLNLGITWSYYGQPANLFHTLTTKRATSATPVWLPTLPLSVTTFPAIPAPKNSWAPSVGFAWTPGYGGRFTGNGKTVIRGGYRLAFDPPFYNIYLNISSAAPNVFLNTLTGASARGNPLPANPTGGTVRTQLAPFLLTGLFDPRRFNETSISPDFGPQKTHEWSLGVQREIISGAVIEARYVGNHATRLFQTVNGNPEILGLSQLFPNLVPSGMTPCPLAQAFDGSFGANVRNGSIGYGRVNCALGVVRKRTNTGYSDYNGLQVELRGAQLWHQFTTSVGYTFSKTTDNASEIFGTGAAGGTTAFAQSQVNFTGTEHGLSGINFRHNFSLSLTEDLPIYRSQQGVLGHILGGWTVSGTYFLASGQPYTPVQGALNCGSGGGSCDDSRHIDGNPYDGLFNNAFVGSDGALRPFLGSNSAPVSSVGIFAGDACGIFGTGVEPICNSAIANSLISLNGINQAANLATYVPAVITNKDVRFIANTATANTVFGTPFGNVGRNTLGDARSNITSIAIFKTVKVKENFKVVWHMSMVNAFNHPNFSTIDPFIDDAGFATEGNGFGRPELTTGGLLGAVGIPGRSIRFGITLRW